MLDLWKLIMKLNVYPMKTYLPIIIPILSASLTFGQTVVEDFQSFTAGDTFGNGTIIEDPTDSSNLVLQLAPSASQVFDVSGFAEIEQVTFDIYDFGEIIGSGSRQNARYGLSTAGSGGGDNFFVWSTDRPGVDNAGYVASNSTSKTGSVFTYEFLSNRPVTFENDGVGGDFEAGDAAADNGVGQWVNWTFDLALDGSVALSGSGGSLNHSESFEATGGSGITNPITQSNLTHIWARGGPTTTEGVLIDNITVTAIPEPATLGLIAGVIGALALRLRRRG